MTDVGTLGAGSAEASWAGDIIPTESLEQPEVESVPSCTDEAPPTAPPVRRASSRIKTGPSPRALAVRRVPEDLIIAGWNTIWLHSMARLTRMARAVLQPPNLPSLPVDAARS